MLTGWGQGHHWGLGWKRERKLLLYKCDVTMGEQQLLTLEAEGEITSKEKWGSLEGWKRQGNGLPTAASRGMQPDSIWEFWSPVCKLTAVKATKCVAFCYSSNKWTHNKQAAWLCGNLCTTVLCRMRMVTTGCIAKMPLRSPSQAGMWLTW